MATYPVTEPYDHGLMPTGDGHQVYWEVCGNPHGKPALVVHGGPGSGATDWWKQFFDPERYRVVLVDQRGCGRSIPNAADDVAALRHNTTEHLVADFERLREELGIDRWLLFGGSWGSTLALAYAVARPERVSGLVLWGVTTTRADDVAWLTHVMGHVYPAEFDELLAVLPEEQRDGNIPAAVHRLLVCGDSQVEEAAARAWCTWEDRLSTLSGPVRRSARFEDARSRLGFARLVTHYFGNYAFLPDEAIIGHLDRLDSIPTYLLRGRLDIASSLRPAYEIARRVASARLDVVEDDAHGPGGGSADRLVSVLDAFAAPTAEAAGQPTQLRT
jgi:proline iminopeptidase